VTVIMKNRAYSLTWASNPGVRPDVFHIPIITSVGELNASVCEQKNSHTQIRLGIRFGVVWMTIQF